LTFTVNFTKKIDSIFYGVKINAEGRVLFMNEKPHKVTRINRDNGKIKGLSSVLLAILLASTISIGSKQIVSAKETPAIKIEDNRGDVDYERLSESSFEGLALKEELIQKKKELAQIKRQVESDRKKSDFIFWLIIIGWNAMNITYLITSYNEYKNLRKMNGR